MTQQISDHGILTRPRKMRLFPWLVVIAAVGYWHLGRLAPTWTLNLDKIFWRHLLVGRHHKAILILGDSFSDDGRLFREYRHETWPAPKFYWNGRYSNGPIWSEYLQAMAQGANKVAYGGSVFPVPQLNKTRSTPGLLKYLIPKRKQPVKVVNLALGGSPACESNKDWAGRSGKRKLVVPWLANQVDDFFGLVNGTKDGHKMHLPPPAHRVVFMQTGGNDFLNQLENVSAAHDFDLHLPTMPHEIGGCVKAAAERLLAAGEKFLVIFTLPAVDKVPQAQALGIHKVSAFLYNVTEGCNKHLRKVANKLQHEHPHASIKVYELGAAMEHILSNPDKHGLTNVRDPCLRFKSKAGNVLTGLPVIGDKLEGVAYWLDVLIGTQIEGVCDDPEQHMWWDKLHPTTYVHSLLARDLSEHLQRWGWK